MSVIGESEAVFVIAEAGVNHNGSIELARALVDAASAAGADAVKFQTFDTTALVTARARQAEYQVRNSGDVGSQAAMLDRLRLDPSAHEELRDRAIERGLEFMSSPFDAESLDFLVRLGVDRLKLGSGELTNGPLLYRAAQSGLPLILSTGMASMVEIEEALGVVAHGCVLERPPRSRRDLVGLWKRPEILATLRERVTLLHCTTQYPCEPTDVNLRAMLSIRTEFGLSTGYSDHTLGTATGTAAAALGASVIEKHLTTDCALPGPDHRASADPDTFARLVTDIRVVSQALGSPKKEMREVERSNAVAGRKSLVASRRIRRGTVLSPDDIVPKRPGDGRSPMEYWEVIGSVSDHDLEPDDPLG